MITFEFKDYMFDEENLLCSAGIAPVNSSMNGGTIDDTNNDLDVENADGAAKGKKSDKTDKTNNDNVPPANDNKDKGDKTKTPLTPPKTVENTQVNLDKYLEDLTALIAELTKDNNKIRATQREQVMELGKSQVNELNLQAKELKEKASDAFHAALVSGVFSILAGAVSIVGACKSICKTNEAMSKMKEALNQEDEIAKAASQFAAKAIMEKASNIGTISQATSQIVNVGGSIWQAGLNQQAAGHDVAIKKSEARVQEMQTVADQVKDLTQSLKQITDANRDALQSILQDTNQVRRRILG